MSVYRAEAMAAAFPYSVQCPEGHLKATVNSLIDAEVSFAVVQDQKNTIQLSEAAYKNLIGSFKSEQDKWLEGGA